jgi:hypothetical protein
MRWDCEKRGCFNIKMRPKIEVFAECFPGRINFGDIDGIVEIGGNALMLEWKSAPSPLPHGQRIMYAQLTIPGTLIVTCIAGNAETMVVTHRLIVNKGVIGGWKDASLDSVKKFFHRWAVWARKNPTMESQKLARLRGSGG